MNGQQFYGEDGIVSKGVENTIRNICRIGAEGMNGTDEEIIKIMTHVIKYSNYSEPHSQNRIFDASILLM